MKIGFVIPARLKSTRLPKKILMKLNGQTALEWVIDRANSSEFIDEVVVATTGLESDSEISKICNKKNIRYYQGDPNDVLKRFRDTSEYFNFDYAVNITPDNTLFSYYLIDLIVNEIRENPEVDFFKFKDAMLGTGIYAIKKEALDIICEFKDVFDTEIWGPLIHPDYFNVKSIELPEFLKANYRLTLDTPEDYKFLKTLYKQMNITKENLVEIWEIINFLDTNPQIVQINSQVKQSSLDTEVIKKIEERFRENEDKFNKLKQKIKSQRRY